MRTIQQIAQELDAFYYDQDPYGYMDAAGDRQRGLLIAVDLLSTHEGTRQAQYQVAEVAAEDPYNEKNKELLADLIALAESQESETKKEQIEVVLVKVNQAPEVMKIEDSLEVLQKIVGGYIETKLFENDMIIICNEEGKLMNLSGNRRVDCDIIAGDFIVTACNEEGDLISLTQEQQAFAMAVFARPENYTGLDMAEEININIILM